MVRVGSLFSQILRQIPRDLFLGLVFLHRNDAVQTGRFLREARAQARVGHPNVCQVHEVGEVEGRPYIAMQYIDGRSLGELREELSIVPFPLTVTPKLDLVSVEASKKRAPSGPNSLTVAVRTKGGLSPCASETAEVAGSIASTE